MPTSPTSDDTPEWVKGDLPPATAAGPAANSRPDERDGAPPGAPVTKQDEHGEQAASPEAAAAEAARTERAMAQDAAAEVAGPQHAVTESAVTDAGGAKHAPADVAAVEDAGAEHVVSEEQAGAELPLVPSGQINGPHDLPDLAHSDLDQHPQVSAEPAVTVNVVGAHYSVQNTQHAIRNTLPSAPDPANSIEALISTPLSLEAQVESLLFVADGAVPVGRLAEALEVSSRDIEAALTSLSDVYRQRGLSLQRFRDKVQLTTSPAAAGRVERFLGLAAATPLSRAALETLAIVAYQQPVTRPQIEAVRGVNSDSVIKNLLGKGLIEELGRAEGPGRPVLYSTTPEFMQHFGLASLSDLPPLSQSGPEVSLHPVQILKG